MYISIPKEFYVPVTYGDRHGLNIWDSSANRPEPVNPIDENTIISQEAENSMNALPKDDLYSVIDEEYVNSAVNSALIGRGKKK